MVFPPSRLRYFIAAIFILTLYQANSQIVTQQLYLSDPSQGLDLIDPVTTGDLTTSSTSILGYFLCGSNGSFSTPTTISNDLGGNDAQTSDLAVYVSAGGTKTLHTVFLGKDNSGDNKMNIYYSSKTGAAAWTAPVPISANNWNQDAKQFPSIKVDSNNKAHVVYAHRNDSADSKINIYYVTNLSGSWSVPARISDDTFGFDAFTPEIALDTNGKAYVVYQHRSSSDPKTNIYYVTNVGGTWSTPFRISIDDIDVGLNPAIAVDAANKAHVLYTLKRTSDSKINIYYLTNASGSWSSPERVSDDSFGQDALNNPSIVIGPNGYPHAVYSHKKSTAPADSNYNIYYVNKTTGSWSTPANISQDVNAKDSRNPDFGFCSTTKVRVAFSNDAKNIFYTEGSDTTWNAPTDINPTTPTKSSAGLYPAIAVSDMEVDVVFQDEGVSLTDINIWHTSSSLDGNFNETTFTQAPALCNTLTIKAGETITVSNFLSIESGTMPANPSINAELKYGATNIFTLSNPTYNSGTGLLTWTGALGSDVAVPAGESIALTVTTTEPNVSFYIDYDSQTKPSYIEFSMDSGANIFPPNIPSLISGNISPSLGSTQTYSVVNEPGLSYNWVLPSGWIQTGGGTSNSITVTVGSLTGTISVTPNNGACDGETRVLSLFTAVKQLYLSDSYELDRLDPVATNDATTATTPVLSAGSTVTVDLIAIKDTGIKLKNDSVNYGSCTSLDIDREATDLQRALFQFDLSSIPAGAIIESAELRLNCTSGDQMSVSIFKIGATDTWSEGTLCGSNGASNWTQRTSTSNWSAEGAIGPNASSGTPEATINANNTGIQIWPLTCLVSDWVTGISINNGIAVGSQDGGGNRTVTYDTRETTTGVKPTLRVTYSTNAIHFVQNPTFCSPFVIKESSPITITNYINEVSGTMPSNPDITAILKTDCSNTIATLTDPSYDSTTNLLTWSGTLASDTTIPAGETIILVVGSNESAVDFTIDYDSATKPSKIEFSTSTFIEMLSYDVYDEPYPAGSIITSAEAGNAVYLRAEVTDPFGAYDITDLEIDNQGIPVSGTPVDTDICSKTFEYPLFTPITTGTYSYSATAKEGYENTVTDSLSLNLTITTPRIDFDGVDDHIDLGAIYNFTGAFSLEVWVLQEAASGTKTALSKTDMSVGSRRGYQFAIVDGIPTLQFFDGSGNMVLNISTSPHSLSNNKWFHLAATFDGSTAKLFVDGIELASGNPSSAIGYGTEPFLIGASYNSTTPATPTNYFDGFIDEVRIWNIALTEAQIHEMMNQEIEQNGTSVKGTVIPIDISGGLLWSDLKGYYPMDDNTTDDKSGNANYGNKKNINSIQEQTAPLPYTTKASGNWTDTTITTPWTYGDTVWDYPNSTGIDGSAIDWNIVVTNHNIDINNHVEVLGLIVESNQLQVNGTTDMLTGNDTGYALTVSKYLKLDGKIDLEGGSQLVQGLGSVLDVTSSGTLERDQQGTADTYTYNYWSSPVGLSNSTSNNNDYKVTDVFQNVAFLNTGYDGTVSPLRNADYWIWKFSKKTSGDYSQWQHVRQTGTIKVGEGFTMKGPGTSTIPDLQNYVFEGKPNNGDISLGINTGNDYLVGNPYPSALDANQFITDNDPTIGDGLGGIDGTLYFWQHFGGGSHILAEYIGGYATYSLAGGAPAPIMGPPPGIIKEPGRYISVAQGFFVIAEADGNIQFNNGQRVFHEEDPTSSMFIKPVNTKANEKSTSQQMADGRTKLRLGFNSVNTMHRQLLVTIDSLTTLGYDWGYDAPNIDNQIDDMFWLIDDEKYVIQAIHEMNEHIALPFGLHLRNDGLNNITIDKLENTPEDLVVYVHDKELNSYHNLSQDDYEIFLLAGDYLNRFEITFSTNQALDIEDVKEKAKIEVFYSNEKKHIIIQNPVNTLVKSIELYNVLGQSIFKREILSTKNNIEYGVTPIRSGVYILNIDTANGILSKKVLIE
jgi:hypothetical protein